MDQLIQRDDLVQNPATPSTSIVPCIELPGHPIRSQSNSKSVQVSAISIWFCFPVLLIPCLRTILFLCETMAMAFIPKIWTLEEKFRNLQP